jgi:hypothetical protein
MVATVALGFPCPALVLTELPAELRAHVARFAADHVSPLTLAHLPDVAAFSAARVLKAVEGLHIHPGADYDVDITDALLIGGSADFSDDRGDYDPSLYEDLRDLLSAVWAHHRPVYSLAVMQCMATEHSAEHAKNEAHIALCTAQYALQLAEMRAHDMTSCAEVANRKRDTLRAHVAEAMMANEASARTLDAARRQLRETIERHGACTDPAQATL